jgi:hypothetical protein
MKLVDRITKDSMTPAKGGEPADGVEYRDPGSWDRGVILREGMLQGEPPRAQSKGWGDLTFLYAPYGGGY